MFILCCLSLLTFFTKIYLFRYFLKNEIEKITFLVSEPDLDSEAALPNFIVVTFLLIIYENDIGYSEMFATFYIFVVDISRATYFRNKRL